MGPNFKKLVCQKMAVDAIPPDGGLMDGIKFFQGDIAGAAREAQAWVRQAIDAVKAAPANPYGDDDEAIAGEILRQIEERQNENQNRGDNH